MVRAGPNEYLLVGRNGTLENRGSAVSTYLRPGTIYVLVPSTKQEAAFEFTQETKDGVPLRFKGTFIYRITDPVATAAMFDFTKGDGTTQITTLLTHVCYGELRHAVSHMTMVECIEQRKTTLSGVIAAALAATVHPEDPDTSEWGVRIEASQVAQVFIVDPTLRQQLEAEVRNEIKLKADQSNMQAQEQFQLAELASATRISEQKLAADQATLRREEEMETSRVARQRRNLLEAFETEKQAGALEKERLHAKLAADQDRVKAEAPVRLLQIETERRVLAEELALRTLQGQLKALDVEQDLLGPRAQQTLDLERLPIENAPEIVEAAARVLQGTNLTVYGDGAEVLGHVAPLFGIIARAVQQATPGPVGQTPAEPQAADETR
ncbi:MAG TPA: SPFH domain-containing protein [Candidatus Limnocylindrales bacterium]|nr:SPFH domain-containing protein [Candidatus Limnocylindrales bacterium]